MENQQKSLTDKLDKKKDLIDLLIDYAEKKTVKEAGIYLLTAFSIANSLHMITISHERRLSTKEGRSQGIELMQTIYNTQGGNEALRYNY